MAYLASPIPGAIVWSLTALVGYVLLTTIYNLYFHPLRKYPGPLLYRASRLPRALRILRGRWTHDLVDLAEQYGPVVRVAPHVLVYTGADAWRDIFGHQNGAVTKGEEFAKDPQLYRARNQPPNILGESRDNHALIRRQLSHGFSDKSLRAQEDIIRGYVDLLIRRLRERCVPVAGSAGSSGEVDALRPSKTAFDMRHWLNYATFDVIGDLAFGEPFGCLENGAMDERVEFLEGGLRTANLTYFIKELGLERFTVIIARRVGAFRAILIEQMSAVLRRRMNLNVERPDLIGGLLRKQEDWTISFERLRSNATLLIIAGSETTATILSGTIFLLLQNPTCLEKLTKEVRSTFKSEDEITFSSVEHLTYMIACLREALRYYPPVAGEMPRLVPKGGAHVGGEFVPEGTTVCAAQYPMNHSSRNFSDSFSFKPERFLEPEKFTGDNFDVLQPFSNGPRNCIGRNLANAEMRTILARLVYNFDMELVDPNNDWLDQNVFFLWTKPPLNVYLTPVKQR